MIEAEEEAALAGKAQGDGLAAGDAPDGGGEGGKCAAPFVLVAIGWDFAPAENFAGFAAEAISILPPWPMGEARISNRSEPAAAKSIWSKRIQSPWLRLMRNWPGRFSAGRWVSVPRSAS